jgi:hypothetical protein
MILSCIMSGFAASAIEASETVSSKGSSGGDLEELRMQMTPELACTVCASALVGCGARGQPNGRDLEMPKVVHRQIRSRPEKWPRGKWGREQVDMSSSEDGCVI